MGASDGDVKFLIRSEKCPNRRGVELIVQSAGGKVLTVDELVEKAKGGGFSAAWIVGGGPQPWVSKELGATAAKIALVIAQDMFENVFTQAATLILPACAFAERDGSFMNHAGRVQPFAWSIDPPEGAKRDGQYLYELAGYEGVFNAGRVRAMMAEEIPAFAAIHEAPPAPRHLH